MRQLLVKWEEGDAGVRELWRAMNRWVLAGFAQTYERMGVRLDQSQHESQTYEVGKMIVEDGLARGVFTRRGDGAVICDLTQVGLSGEKVRQRN